MLVRLTKDGRPVCLDDLAFVADRSERIARGFDLVNQTQHLRWVAVDVEFERDGRSFRLEALGEPGRELFFVLADRTSGHGSYPAGRFPDAQWPGADGKVVLDFNRAYNPPCAFSAYTTCPLPPPQNWLKGDVAAGEKYAGRKS